MRGVTVCSNETRFTTKTTSHRQWQGLLTTAQLPNEVNLHDPDNHSTRKLALTETKELVLSEPFTTYTPGTSWNYVHNIAAVQLHEEGICKDSSPGFVLAGRSHRDALVDPTGGLL